MEKEIKDKVNLLRSVAGNQDEFMKKLAELDEKGQLTDDVLNMVNGGISFPGLPKWLGLILS
ncbi:hypothetical protein [Spirosoma flavum]|uniref:Bacteriocin n=1 Tax=Spirosoma flavum TaxID=2048557 RepID=A0ABW6AH84_9BACT